MNWSLDLGMLTGITPTNSIPVTANPILHTNRINITITISRVTQA
jgi:hypothetical protein